MSRWRDGALTTFFPAAKIIIARQQQRWLIASQSVIVLLQEVAPQLLSLSYIGYHDQLSSGW
jgi:hypothetical protein